jgi:phosphoserine phosphatase RsbU/P
MLRPRKSQGRPVRVLIAEDDAVSRAFLAVTLREWGYEVVETSDGGAAWRALAKLDAPRLAILDWMMPHLDGLELCAKIRRSPPHSGTYVILLTARRKREDVLRGLRAGADDYLTKPFDREELQARLQVGQRVLDLQASLSEHLRELEAALRSVQKLQGLLPICAYCKKIRNDQNYWQQVESYLSEHLQAQFTHGICPECFEKIAQQDSAIQPAGKKVEP